MTYLFRALSFPAFVCLTMLRVSCYSAVIDSMTRCSTPCDIVLGKVGLIDVGTGANIGITFIVHGMLTSLGDRASSGHWRLGNAHCVCLSPINIFWHRAFALLAARSACWTRCIWCRFVVQSIGLVWWDLASNGLVAFHGNHFKSKWLFVLSSLSTSIGQEWRLTLVIHRFLLRRVARRVLVQIPCCSRCTRLLASMLAARFFGIGLLFELACSSKIVLLRSVHQI